eukprot:gnl/MRDRNA2_/MRDRNA2_106703_c0_seq1.p1 gnl/MRDRNA2_/MRDRNA2_106703_c0~~gnl/MRDRNA2_/MRDRNA2_106703_c0_seq1.p1  ORF type:complete len:285 (+),score=49.16 gnl/MRDRNA2_/MRDRNA2_106703_c0_seq1:38-856(+)
MSPEGDGPTKDAEVEIPPLPVEPAPPQFTWIRKTVPDVVTTQVPEKRMVEQIVMVPVRQMVEQVVMVPQQTYTSKEQVESVDAKGLSAGCIVKLYKLKNNAEMNGAEGVLEVYDDEQAAWKVNLKNGQGVVTVKPENLIQDLAKPGAPPVPIVRTSSQSMIAPSVPPFPLASVPTVIPAQPQVLLSARGYPTPFAATPPVGFRSETPPPLRPEPAIELKAAIPSTPTRIAATSGIRSATPTMMRSGVYQSTVTPPTTLGQPVRLPDMFTPRR